MAARPDLLAARASAAAAWQRARAAKRRLYPTLTLDASANRDYYIPEQTASYSDSWGVSLTVNYSLWSGLSDSYKEQRARWEGLAAEADVQTLERRAAVEVWSAYHQMRTTAEQLQETGTLLDTAERLENLQRGRYKAGVATILDLMSAQATLASARSSYVNARAAWLTAVVQLAHDAGELRRRSLEGRSSAKAAGRRPHSTPSAKLPQTLKRAPSAPAAAGPAAGPQPEPR